jgi:predicted  nucleic acid-binding Zn-ribbon protein
VNEDLLEIRKLLRVETELEELKQRAGDLAATVKKRRARVSLREGERDQAVSELPVAKEAERLLQRRVEDYVRKRDKTQQLIDEGKAPDFLAAERQVKGCQEVIDRLEGELLEAMEARERVEARIAAAEEAIGIEKARVRDALTRQSDQRPAIEQRWKELAPLRKQRRADMAHDLLRRYDDLRTRKRPVLISVVSGSCEHCHMSIAPNLIQNFDRDRLVACKGCGCWLWEVVEPEDPAPDDED